MGNDQSHERPAASLRRSLIAITAATIGLAVVMAAAPARADPIAYASVDPFTNYPDPNPGEFGTVDLLTGAFTQVAQPPGSIGPTNPPPPGYIGGLVTEPGNTLYTSYAFQPAVLGTVDPLSGALSVVGTMPTIGFTGADAQVESLGSTTSGLFMTDRDYNLYSVNPATAQTRFIANIGEPGSLLSTNGAVLYGAFGPTLYSIDPTTGATTLIGTPLIDGSTAYDWSALAVIDGTLYGSGCCNTTFDGLYTIDLSNVSATYVGGNEILWGIAPETFMSSGPSENVPEPAGWALLPAGLAGLGAACLRRRVSPCQSDPPPC